MSRGRGPASRLSTAPSAAAARLLAAAVSAVLLAAAVLTGFTPVPVPAAQAAAGDYAGALTLDVTGRYADNPARSARSGLVVGAAASTWRTSTSVQNTSYGFEYTVGCTVGSGTACTTLGTTLHYRWDFGDGTRTETTSATTTHKYTRPGSYTARVTVDNRSVGENPAKTYTGQGSIAVLVSARYADVDATDTSRGKTSPVDAEQIWAVSALGLLPPCRTYFPSVTERVTGEQDGDPGRAEFCGQAPAQRALAAPEGSTGTVAFTTNAVTGADCLSSVGACGLPADVFAENATPTGDPTGACTTACQNQLRALGLLDTFGRVVYSNSVCEDNWVAVRRQPTLAPGVELGCVSYGDFLTALVRAVDSDGATGTLAADCAAGTSASPAVRRGAALFAPSADDLGVGTRLRVCDTDATLTKADAYALLAAAAGLTPDSTVPVLSQLRDLSDPTLQGGSSPDPLRPVIGAVLAAGGPLVGNLACPDKRIQQAAGKDPKSCFNGSEALQRREAAQLLSFLALTPQTRAGTLRMTLATSTARTELGTPVQVRARIQAPAWYPADAVLTLKWATTPYGSLACGQESITLGADRTVDRTCLFTPTQDPGSAGATLSATVTDDQGAAATTATVTVAVVNDPPAFTAESSWTKSPAGAREGDVWTVTAGYRDPQGNPVTFGVRSCLPARDGASACVSTGPTFARNAGRSRTSTSDTAPAGFADAANTDLGTIQVLSSTASTVTLRHTSYNADNNGSFDFVLQMCDSGAACTTRYVRSALAAVNDPPSPMALITVSTTNAAVDFTLGGTDDRDSNQPGYPSPSAPIGTYQVCSLPAAGSGTVYVNSGGTWTAAAVGSQTTSATMRFIPVNGTYGISTMTYKVADRGDPGVAWSGGSSACSSGGTSSVRLQNLDPGAAPVAALSVSPSVTEAYSGEVTASAAGSVGTNLASYTFSWGDGTVTGPQAGSSATHRYTTSSDATYTVKVTVTDQAGRSATKTAGVAAKRNLIGNPTFEAGTARVAAGSGTTISATTAAAHGGAQGLRATASAGSSSATVTDSPATVAAASSVGTYTLKAWVRPSAGAVGKSATLTLLESASGAEVKRATRTATLVAGWQQISATLDAAATGHDIAWQLAATSVAAGDSLDIDDMSVTGPASSVNTYAAAVLADDPVAYYRLDDAAGSTTATDSSGNGKHATVSGTATFGGTGAATGSGTSVTLSGSGRVTPPALGLDTTAGAKTTVEFWTELDTYTAGQMAFSFGNLDLYMQSNSLGFNSYAADLRGAPYAGFGPGKHHVVAVLVNGNLGTSELYVDGANQPLTQVSGTPSASASVAGTFQIGGGNGGSYTWTKSLDEVAVYRGALPAARIVDHFRAGADAGTAAVLADNPAALYRLDELSGTTALDSSGNNRHGTFGGTPVFNQASVAGTGRSVNFNTAAWADLSSLPLSTTTGAKASVELWLDAPAAPSGKMAFGFTSYDLYSTAAGLGFNTGAGDLYGVSWATIGTGRHHVVAVFTSNDPAGNRLYVDGVERTVTQLIAAKPAAARPLGTTARISGWRNDTTMSWPYRIDNVAVYAGELPAERVQAHYTASR